MISRLCLGILLACTALASDTTRARGAERGDRPPALKTAAKAGPATSYVSVIKRRTGEPILVVKYPWKRHARPSVEIRVLQKSEVDDAMIRPLFFVHDIMKGKVTTAVYHCQDRSAGLNQTGTFSKDKVDFEIFGARNALGRPSVCVACGTKPIESERETRARAAFPLLDAWAVDQRTLYLELPPQYFSDPSTIRVWLLRGKDIVWTQTARWPGIPD